jgi:hypothetical protein
MSSFGPQLPPANLLWIAAALVVITVAAISDVQCQTHPSRHGMIARVIAGLGISGLVAICTIVALAELLNG